MTIKFQQNPIKSVRRETVVPVNPAPVDTGFKRNPDDFIGTMQSLDTGKKIFSCQFCGFQGLLKTNVKRHVVFSHIPEAKDNFKCMTCEKQFAERRNLKAHYMQGHGMPENLAKAALDMTKIPN